MSTPAPWTSYLAMGDSVTEGVGDPVGDLPCRSWSDLVAEALAYPMPDLAYRNVGVRRSTAADLLRDQVPILLATRPSFVTITIGGNDARRPEWTPGQLEAELDEILRAAASVGAQVMTFTYPNTEPAIARAGHEIRDSWRLYFVRARQVNEVIRAASERHHTWLLDLEPMEEVTDPRYLSADFTHPNALGYLFTARMALDLLAEKLGVPELSAHLPGGVGGGDGEGRLGRC